MIRPSPSAGLMLALCLVWSATPSRLGAQTFTVLHVFDSLDYASGSAPSGGLVAGDGGVLYGTTQVGGAYSSCPDGGSQGCGTFYSLTPPTAPGGKWTQTVLWSFGGDPSDAYYPSGLSLGNDGVLYGVGGGTGGDANCGSVFSLTPPATPGGTWTEVVLYRFSCSPDGVQP